MTDIGYRLVCDRCGKSIFLNYLGSEDGKGFFDLAASYEKRPDGWKKECINKGMYDFCPACHEVLEKTFKTFMRE